MLPKLGKTVSAAVNANRNGPPLSVIGPDVRISGDIFTQGEMQIDGQVDGDITCQTLVVGEGGRINGAVTAEMVRVHGELSGQISADTVRIAKSARVIGDITHNSLEIEAGAFMEGRCQHKSSSKPQAALAAPAEASKPAPAKEPPPQPKPETTPAANAANG